MTQLPAKPIEKMKSLMQQESVQEQFRNALQDQAPLFIASVVDLFTQDSSLQKCNPADVLRECLKAATLRLPLSKSLGFAYVVPYGNKPVFQIGYRGLVQLAIRSGQYKHLNASNVYQGERVQVDRISGDITISGQPESPEVIGYLASMELTNGFTKAIYWTREEVEAHAKRFSRSYGRKDSAWATDFDAMARKTVLRQLLTKYGLLSIEMLGAIQQEEQPTPAAAMADEIQEQANSEPLPFPEEENPCPCQNEEPPQPEDCPREGPAF